MRRYKVDSAGKVVGEGGGCHGLEVFGVYWNSANSV